MLKKLFFPEIENIDSAGAVTAHPGFEFGIIFKNIDTDRVATTRQRCYFLKIISIDFIHIYIITSITGNKYEFVIFGKYNRSRRSMCFGCKNCFARSCINAGN